MDNRPMTTYDSKTVDAGGMLSSFFRWIAFLAISAAKITKEAEKFAEGQSAMGLLIIAGIALVQPVGVPVQTVWSVVAIGVGTTQGIAVLTMDRGARAKAALAAFCTWVTVIVWFFVQHMKFAAGLSLTSAIISWLVYVFCSTAERVVYDDTTGTKYGDDLERGDTTRGAIKILRRLSDSETKRGDGGKGETGIGEEGRVGRGT